jgi:hypothetical protein
VGVVDSLATDLRTMLVYVHQFREDDAKGTTREGGDVGLDRTSEGYFDVDDLDVDTRERVEVGDRTLQRKATTFDDVAAVSVPDDYTDPDPDPDGLPGATIQLRTAGGETEYVEDAVVVEVQDASPRGGRRRVRTPRA